MDQIDLENLLAGQMADWRQFVEISAPVILTTVRRIFARYGRNGSPDEHEDISQEVYLKLSRNDFGLLRKFDPTKAKLSTYIAVVARSTAIDYLRKQRPEADDIDAIAEKIAIPFNNFDGGGDPAKAPAETGILATLNALPPALLSERQQKILSLLFDQDLDPEDIAEKFGVATQTIRSAKHKAITKIRRYLLAAEADERVI